MAVCFLAIGSNLGKRKNNIKLALQKIEALKDTAIVKIAKLIETEPVGGARRQNKYLNSAVKIKTKLSSQNLFFKLKQIECELGRVVTTRNAPRPIDLDILFFGDKIINSHRLTVPHPRIFERDFVLRPLVEIL